MIRARYRAPFGMRVDDAARVRVGDEAFAERRRVRGIRRLAQPLRDEMSGEWSDGSKLGQAPTGFLDRGRFIRPHEGGPRRTTERALLAFLAALRLKRKPLGDVA